MSSQAIESLQPMANNIPINGLPPVPMVNVISVICAYCQEISVIVERREDARSPYRAIMVWPPPHSAGMADVPDPVGAAFAEGLRCATADAPNAAAAMYRNALQAIIDDKGTDHAKTAADLKGSIKAMVDEGRWPEAIGEFADHVRLTGNAGAHPSKFGDVTPVEAAALANLVRALLELVYVQPASIARLRGDRGFDTRS